MLSESKKVLHGLEIEIPSLKNKIRMLSGGQRQAVAISRARYIFSYRQAGTSAKGS